MSFCNDFRICIDSRMISSSGIGTYIKALINGIISSKKDVKLYLIGNKNELSQYEMDAEIYNQEDYKHIPMVDIYHLTHYNLPFLRIKAKKRVCTIHDICPIAWYGKENIKTYLHLYFKIFYILRFFDEIITDSFFSKQEIIKYFKFKKKIHVIYPGVDIKRYTTKIMPNDIEILKKYNIFNKYFLYTGNIRSHKNVKILVEAYKLLKKEVKEEYKLVIGGARNNNTDNINLLQEIKGDVVITGFIEEIDLPIIYRNASIFVFPSLYEGFGLPPLEAMASGVPVIASLYASIPEVCNDSAYYTNVNSKEDLSFAMEKMLLDIGLQNKYKKLGKINCVKYSWKTMVDLSLNVYFTKDF